MKLRPLLVATFAVLALSACDSSSGSVPEDAYAQAIAEASCERIVRCLPRVPSLALERAMITQGGMAACVEVELGEGASDVAAHEASLAAGRVAYDAGAAKECVDTLGSFCGTGPIAACEQVWVGKVALGGSCLLDDDCAGDAYCAGARVGDPQSPACGVCTAKVAIGEPCNGDDAMCAPSRSGDYARCAATTTDPSLHCIEVTHVRHVEAGGRCGLLKDGETWSEATCSAGLYCRGATANPDSSGVCARPIALASACDPKLDACVDGAICASTAGVSRSYCLSVSVQGQVGLPCQGGSGTQWCNWYERLDCVSGHCASLGTGLLGSSCRPSRGGDCDAELYCAHPAPDPTTGLVLGQCTTKLPDGQACDPTELSSSCESGFCDALTNPSSPVCAAPVCS